MAFQEPEPAEIILPVHDVARPAAAAPPSPPSSPSAAPWERSAYRASSGAHPIAMAVSVGLVAALLSAFAVMDVAPAHRPSHDLKLVELSITPPPPPKVPPPPTRLEARPTSAPAIVAPPPVVAVPSAAPQVATVPVPASPQPVVLAPPGPPAPPAPPAPARAAAAPADAGDLSSRMIAMTPPAYPLEARRKHLEGVVVLMLLLSREGTVADVAVSQSSGAESLDKAALSAVRHWRWAPILRDGEPTEVRGLVRIPFVIRR